MARAQYILFAFMCCLLVAPSMSAEPPGPDGLRAADGSRLMPFGGSCYRIPEWNGSGINASPVPLQQEARRDTNHLLLKFENTEIAGRLKGYQLERTSSGRLVEGLVVSVSILSVGSEAQRRSNESRMHLDLLYAGPGYETRLVERIPGARLYRLFDSPDKVAWMIATRAPDMRRRDTHEAGDLWVAACANFRWQNSPTGSCATHIDRGGFRMSFSTLEPNVLIRERLADYVIAKLDGWKSPCT
jgi:hypothetical protein